MVIVEPDKKFVLVCDLARDVHIDREKKVITVSGYEPNKVTGKLEPVAAKCNYNGLELIMFTCYECHLDITAHQEAHKHERQKFVYTRHKTEYIYYIKYQNGDFKQFSDDESCKKYFLNRDDLATEMGVMVKPLGGNMKEPVVVRGTRFQL